jgi:methionine-rich copper-binding protein CopC
MPADSTNFLAAKGFLLAPLLLSLVACSAGNGQGLDANGQPIPINPPAASQFQEIQDTVFTPICTQCHIGANAPHGLRLDAANSYELLVNVNSDEVPTLKRVNPGNADQSYIVQKIQGNAAMGGRMPLGQAPLPQDRIDLIRSWIAAGAPPAATAPNNLTVSSSIPAAGEVSNAGISKLTVIFKGDVDATLAASGTFELVDGFDQPVALAKAQVPDGRPNVVELSLAHDLAPGSYQLRVRGQGPVALADTAGHVLDGDADGAAGGDFVMSFDVSAGAGR